MLKNALNDGTTDNGINGDTAFLYPIRLTKQQSEVWLIFRSASPSVPLSEAQVSTQGCAISGFHRRIDVNCGLLGSYAASSGRLRLKCDGTRAETRFRLSAKRTSPFKSSGASVQSTTGSRGVRISGCNAGYTMFRGSVKSTGYPLHSPVFLPLPIPCVTVCHHISTGV